MPAGSTTTSGSLTWAAKNGTFTNVNNLATGTINGVMTNQLLGANDNGIAVGFYVDGNGATHGYTYNIAANTFSGNIDDMAGVGTTTAAAINNNGQIAGFYVGADGNMHGFFDNAGTFTTIALLWSLWGSPSVSSWLEMLQRGLSLK